ncbi:MAG TPA: DUF192 domain-containing protein [Candidatus Binataceae bacterium]|nr:DUF192 domain-containing protein [Candidatus Binataceae bacterium]
MPSFAACKSEPAVAIVSPDHAVRATVKVAIAASPETRELGLMWVNHLRDDAGMIFIFPQPQSANFWMKNTMIPLDMLFADSDGKIIGIVANAKPYSESLLGGFANTLYVLEVNGGYAAKHHIAVGDLMKFSGFTPHTNQ